MKKFMIAVLVGIVAYTAAMIITHFLPIDEYQKGYIVGSTVCIFSLSFYHKKTMTLTKHYCPDCKKDVIECDCNLGEMDFKDFLNGKPMTHYETEPPRFNLLQAVAAAMILTALITLGIVLWVLMQK